MAPATIAVRTSHLCRRVMCAKPKVRHAPADKECGIGELRYGDERPVVPVAGGVVGKVPGPSGGNLTSTGALRVASISLENNGASAAPTRSAYWPGGTKNVTVYRPEASTYATYFRE